MFCLLQATPAAGGDRDGPGGLPWRQGGRLGFTVDAAAFPDSLNPALDVYVRLPPATLASLTAGLVEAPRVRVGARLRNRFGALHHEASQEFVVAPGDTGGGFGKVVLIPFPAPPGRYQLEVRVEDVLSRKRGLAYVGRKVAETAMVDGVVDVLDAETGQRLSDIGFVWGGATATGEAFRHAADGAVLLPNPERLFGLFADEFRAHFLARGAPDRAWWWRARILDADGQVVADRETTQAATTVLQAELRFDVTTLPAGGYELELEVRQQGDSRHLLRRGRFSVAWQMSAWFRNPRDIEDDVHFLLDGDREEAFASMSPGEQESFLEKFWKERDPSPATAENEARLEFVRRLEYANLTWSRSGRGKGIFTDMGRAYIRHGDPDEILRQIIPAGDQTLAQLVQEITASEDRSATHVQRRGLGADVRPFEVWVYQGARTRPITATVGSDVESKTMKRLLFLFVDEQGYGDYRLRYSTE